jgi:hypothetical protein
VGFRQSKIDLGDTKTHRLEACATKLSEQQRAYVVDMYAKFRHSVDSSQERGGTHGNEGEEMGRQRGGEVLVAGTTSSVVLADQVKSIDWRVRNARRKGAVFAEELGEVRAKILALIC